MIHFWEHLVCVLKLFRWHNFGTFDKRPEVSLWNILKVFQWYTFGTFDKCPESVYVEHFQNILESVAGTSRNILGNKTGCFIEIVLKYSSRTLLECFIHSF